MCMRARAETRHACAAHAPTACNPQNKYMGQTPPSACVGVLQPPTTIPSIQPHIHRANPLDYEDSPGEPLNQYSPFSTGQEYHPSCPLPWTNFRHRPRRLSLRFVAVRNSIFRIRLLFTMHGYCTMRIFNFFFFRK